MPTKVNNPYSLNVQTDLQVSADINKKPIVLPEQLTYLAEGNSWNGDTNFIVPEGVNVILCSIDGHDRKDGDVIVEVEMQLNNITVCNKNDYMQVSASAYVGVTPGKSYSIYTYFGGDFDDTIGDYYVAYSKSINEHKTNIDVK